MLTTVSNTPSNRRDDMIHLDAAKFDQAFSIVEEVLGK